MKRIVPILILLFLLCGCARTPLETVLSEALSLEESLPAGQMQVYGRMYKKSMSRDFLTDYFGCAGFPEFPDKIEEMALYTSLTGDYAEVCVLRVYDAADRYDAALFLERRIASARYALKNFDFLYNKTTLFSDALQSCTLPESVKDAISANLSVLKAPTSIRLEDGSFWGWEGCSDMGGSCYGTCQHVWNYPTINEYLLKVYHRPPGARYDRLIGTAVCYSGK